MVCSRSPGSLDAQDLGLSPGLWPVSSGNHLGGQACLTAEFIHVRRVRKFPEEGLFQAGAGVLGTEHNTHENGL